jgi:hypothetical protein
MDLASFANFLLIIIKFVFIVAYAKMPRSIVPSNVLALFDLSPFWAAFTINIPADELFGTDKLNARVFAHLPSTP